MSMDKGKCGTYCLGTKNTTAPVISQEEELWAEVIMDIK
jgi:hypothetical protein